MKVYIEFDFSDPEEVKQHAEMLKADSYKRALHDYYEEHLRAPLKYWDDKLFKEAKLDKHTLEEMKQRFFEILKENEVDIY